MIVVVDYGVGNLRSVANAFDAIGQPVTISSDVQDLRTAAGIVLPGVGAFPDGMRRLHAAGVVDVLTEEVQGRGKPFLGICLGMQFLADESTEGEGARGLGWIPGTVRRLEPKDPRFKVPHIGWNELALTRDSTLYADLGEEPVYYFVHSYHFAPSPDAADVVTATCWHGETFAASVERGNVFGVQFHPEKSQRVGLRILENFVALVRAAA